MKRNVLASISAFGIMLSRGRVVAMFEFHGSPCINPGALPFPVIPMVF